MTGVLNALDILSADSEESIQRYVRPVQYAPMTKNISELMFELLKDRDVVTVVMERSTPQAIQEVRVSC